MDIELTVDVLELADVVDHYVLFSGDGDFRTLVEAAAAARTQGQRGLDHGLAAADDFRRSAPAGRSFHRPDDAEERGGPRSFRTAGPASRTGRNGRRRLLTARYARCIRRSLRATVRSVRACMISSPRGASASRAGSTHRCRHSCRLRARSGALSDCRAGAGLRGANRTGRPFTGDYAGELLYQTLIRFGFARGHFAARPDDGLALVGTAITNAVRCVPPDNKPVGEEINTCRHFLIPTLARFPKLEAILTLGTIAHQSTRAGAWKTRRALPLPPWRQPDSRRITLFSSYHCSRYNTNTGVLTEEMFVRVFGEIAAYLRRSNSSELDNCQPWFTVARSDILRTGGLHRLASELRDRRQGANCAQN